MALKSRRYAANSGSRRERKRLGVIDYQPDSTASPIERSPGVERPGRFWFNLAMTLVIMVGIVLQIVPLPIAMLVFLLMVAAVFVSGAVPFVV